MARYQHVIWDWNGTLLNDVELCIDVINAMLRDRDMSQIDTDRYREIFDFPVVGYYEILGFDFTVEPFADLAHQYCDAYEQRVTECSLHAGVEAILERVAAAVPRQSILSSCEQVALDQAVTNFGLVERFETIAGLSDRHAKGKVEAGRALFSSTATPGSRTVLVGDTLHDCEVAQALGIDCILVANGHHSRHKLETVNDRVVDTLEQVAEHLA